MQFLLSFDPWLVALSFIVAAFTSLTALDLAGRLRAAEKAARYVWLCGGALAMGGGIWSMHFIGMLAMKTGGHMQYDLSLTLLSMLAAMLASALALLIVCAPTPTTGRLSVGGLTMGAGVCLMHYLGMEAMLSHTPTGYDPTLFSVSVLIAIGASTAALWLSFYLNGSVRSPLWLRSIAALVMAVGITGMHYTGMAAAIYDTTPFMTHSTTGIAPDYMAITIAGIASGILLIAMLMAVYDSHLVSKTTRLANSLQEANQELRSLALMDPLTRMPNRLAVEQRLESGLVQADDRNTGFAVLFVDLDRFKSINDSLGHHAGDQLLKLVGKRLQSSTRNDDIVARVGGDEFLIVTGNGTSREESTTLARRIIGSLESPFQLDQHIVRTSCSVGISLYPEHGDSAHLLIVHADTAMYRAKDLGRNKLQFYEHGMRSMQDRRNQLEQRLRLALEENSLKLAYQPKVDVDSGRTRGVEALLRWTDTELGEVPPEEAIAIAEDTGLIVPIGEWVLREACSQLERWRTSGLGELTVAVNLSARQLNEKDFVSRVRHILEETGLAPEQLEFELTETAIMQDPDNALRIFRQLDSLGIALSIDDFGTGYSNLSQLKRFPIRCLKVDRSFTAGVTSDHQDAAIVRALIMLAHSLDLEVVAEGVETDAQLDFIRRLKGQQYQGYLYSRPLPAADIGRLITAERGAGSAGAM
ncbi:putative bifunctional diguanylate cyclase/phosphodiesterase [Parahaliea aestuarii]|uniref:cyclic-guanylate-specific phosphodiesterase n=1 Tax=Parahaliea aestuarii TaxID=1852021 RepID=A0A5C9A2V6_9GAMM|nr:bifunctional diguanylate cyclase/phosphodiesterase [Parahaliea aestuarii]TXS94409.1 EAL domain-containing protein [Parahaliea aestuarii]